MHPGHRQVLVHLACRLNSLPTQHSARQPTAVSCAAANTSAAQRVPKRDQLSIRLTGKRRREDVG